MLQVSHRTQKMFLEYETPEAAAFAVDRLSGFEYPIGEPVMLKPEFGWYVHRNGKFRVD